MLVSGLECLRCEQPTELTPESYLCPRCGTGERASDAGILDVLYDYAAARKGLLGANGDADLFRYLPLLPVEERGQVPPVGWTPLYEAPALAGLGGLDSVLLKDETRNPTRALKDRATAVGVSRAKALGYEDIYCASAGNAAISLAGFSAYAGLRAHVFVPNAASEVRLGWLARFGADTRRSSGDYDFAFDEAEEMRSRGWYSRNCAFNPFLVEGKKTAGLEIAEQLGWSSPDLIVCPVGDACTLAAIGKAFRELTEMGIVDRLPRLIGVQSRATHPVVDRFDADRGRPVAAAGPATTTAASIDVKEPRNLTRLLNELERSGGTMIAVDDEEIGAAQRELAERSGIVVEFTSAASLGALRRLAEEETLAGQRAVLILTGGRPDDA